jgi:hypothetical protein
MTRGLRHFKLIENFLKENMPMELVAIAAAYKCTMLGGDLEGAYLVTRTNEA